MDSITEYRSHILEEYRQQIEDDLKLLEHERAGIENSLRNISDLFEIGSRVAAIRQVCEVLASIQRVLEDAQRTSLSHAPVPMPRAKTRGPCSAGDPRGLVGASRLSAGAYAASWRSSALRGRFPGSTR